MRLGVTKEKCVAKAKNEWGDYFGSDQNDHVSRILCEKGEYVQKKNYVEMHVVECQIIEET
jgi:hypothetical protein